MYGLYSPPIIVATNKTVRPSVFDIRLVPTIRGLNFLGRVEVNYNETWGTVCDFRFDNTDADVICQRLNYVGAACSIYNGAAGIGSGKIWLTGLICYSAEVLDDCRYTIYNPSSSTSTQYCRTTHTDDVGVACFPNEGEFLPQPQNFTANFSDSSSSTVVLTWKRYVFPSYVRSSRIRIQYTRSDRTGSYTTYATPSSTTTSLRINRLGVTVNATINAQGRFTQYNCYTYLNGDKSGSISITTIEKPPSSPPHNFHVYVVNCSAIMAEWDVPSISSLNGNLRGFKLIYQAIDGSENVLDLPANVTEYIIEGLKPATSYIVSVLAYTVGDGPRSIHLTAITNNQSICQTDVIDFFGVNGNDFDRLTAFYYSTSINVFCGSNLPMTKINWFYSNGTSVGSSNGHIRESNFSNGTTVLQIGSERRLTLCDAGIYICRANTTNADGNQRTQQRTFKLLFNRTPPVPRTPIVLKVDSSSAIIKWPQIDCDGGHDLDSYTVRILHYPRVFYNPRYRYLNNVDPQSANYTLVGLSSRTDYTVSLQAVGKDNTQSGYSPSVTFKTLPPKPTPPRYVVVKLIAPNTILVNWMRSSVTNGDLLYYTVYATPFISKIDLNPRTKRQTDSLQRVAKNFSANVTSGNVTLPQVGVQYNVHVTVTVRDTTTGQYRESSLSSLTSNSTLYVPIQGLPVPINVRISSSSNNSLTVNWTTPSTGDTITGYLIEYSGDISGETPGGNFIKYTKQGKFTTAANVNSFKVQPLVPQTSYQLKVSALTTRGEGRQVTVTGTTDITKTRFERYVYFHVRFGPVPSCASFRKDINGQEDTISQQLYGYLQDMCNCGFTDDNIETGFFSCGQQNHQIIYSAHIIGTTNYSAIDLVNLMQNWVQSGRANITINGFRMQLDPTCSTRLDTLDDPECPVIDIQTQVPTTAPTKTPLTTSSTTYKQTEPKTKPIFVAPKITQQPETTEMVDDIKSDKDQQAGNLQPQSQHSSVSTTALLGLLVGIIIAFLLLILIVLVLVIFFSKLNKKTNAQPQNNISVRNTFKNQLTAMRYSELEKSNEKSEEKMSDKNIYEDMNIEDN